MAPRRAPLPGRPLRRPRSHTSALRLALLALLAQPLAGRVAAAAQEGAVVRVRAHSELQLTEERRTVLAGGRLSEVRLGLALRDGASGAALPGERVILSLQGESGLALAPLDLRTDDEGRSTGAFTGLRSGRYLAVARYAGDALRDRAATSLPLDLLRRGAQLGLSVPSRAPLLGELSITVDLHDGDVPLRGPVALRVAGRPVKLPWRDGHGTALLRLDPRELPGVSGGASVPVEATFAGDAFYDERSERRVVSLTTQAKVTLDPLPGPAGGDVAQGSRLLVSGEAHDEEGPLGGEGASLLLVEGSSERALGLATVDGAGRFRVRVDRLEEPLGPITVLVVVRPSRSYRLPGRSEPLRLQVMAPEPVPLRYFIVPVGATLLGLALALVFRRRAWISALRRPVDPDAAPPPDPTREPQPGVTLRPRSTVQSILGRPDFTIGGHVVDAAFGGPVIAEVVVGGAEPLRCDEAGRFQLPLLPPGRHDVEVRAEGYLPERFTAQLPHRGELRAVQVALLPIRARIMAAWREVARPFLPHAEAATWTPREVLRDVRERARRVPLPALARLTDLVEETYYSGRLPDTAALREAEALAAEVQAAAPPPVAGVPPERQAAMQPQPGS